MPITETFKEKISDDMRTYRRGVFMNPLMDFINSDNNTLVYKCVDNKEKINCVTSLKQYIARHDLALVVWSKKNNVYVIKG